MVIRQRNGGKGAALSAGSRVARGEILLLLDADLGLSASEARLLFATPLSLGLVFVLSVPCTVIAFSLMNRYQPDVGASEAGIIYGAEPLFASLFALFLPAVFARWAGVPYANEQLTGRLLIGGGLVIAANVLLQVSWSDQPKVGDSSG